MQKISKVNISLLSQQKEEKEEEFNLYSLIHHCFINKNYYIEGNLPFF